MKCSEQKKRMENAVTNKNTDKFKRKIKERLTATRF